MKFDPYGEDFQPKILIVDDRRENLLALEATLEPLDSSILRASSGKEALRTLSEEEYIGVVLLDVQMPNMDGFETAKKINVMFEGKQQEPLMVFISAIHKTEAKEYEGLSLGAVDYIFKPYEPELIQTKVRTFLDLYRKNFLVRRQAKRLEEERHERNRLIREKEKVARKLEEVNNGGLTELAERSQEIGEFIYYVSHELKQPLRQLSSFADFFMDDLEEYDFELSEELEKDLYFIVDGAHRAEDIVDALENLSEAGSKEIEFETVSMESCVETALEDLQEEIDEAGAEVEWDDLPEVTACEPMVVQLLQNLMGNAAKFVNSETPKIKVTSNRKNDRTVFGVKDNGIGIEPKKTDEIFKPLKRLHGPNQFEGAGIGLAICRKIVERHDGDIWVDSTPGEGSHIQFTLDPENATGSDESSQKLNKEITEYC